MPTCTEQIQTILEAFDWTTTTYGSQPAIAIEGIKRKPRVPKNRRIILREINEDLILPFNESIVIYSDLFCELEFAETSTTLRDNLYEAIKEAFADSSYSVIPSNIRPDHRGSVFLMKMKLKLLN